MKKNVLLGIVAFGGIILVTAYLANNPTKDNSTNTTNEEVVAEEINIPAGFPTYPNATVSNFRESSSEDSDDASFRLVATASMNQVHTWYREALNQNGWKITSDKNVAGYQIIQAENGNLYTSLQTANGEEGQIIISQQTIIRK